MASVVTLEGLGEIHRSAHRPDHSRSTTLSFVTSYTKGGAYPTTAETSLEASSTGSSIETSAASAVLNSSALENQGPSVLSHLRWVLIAISIIAIIFITAIIWVLRKRSVRLRRRNAADMGRRILPQGSRALPLPTIDSGTPPLPWAQLLKGRKTSSQEESRRPGSPCIVTSLFQNADGNSRTSSINIGAKFPGKTTFAMAKHRTPPATRPPSPPVKPLTKVNTYDMRDSGSSYNTQFSSTLGSSTKYKSSPSHAIAQSNSMQDKTHKLGHPPHPIEFQNVYEASESDSYGHLVGNPPFTPVDTNPTDYHDPNEDTALCTCTIMLDPSLRTYYTRRKPSPSPTSLIRARRYPPASLCEVVIDMYTDHSSSEITDEQHVHEHDSQIGATYGTVTPPTSPLPSRYSSHTHTKYQSTTAGSASASNSGSDAGGADWPSSLKQTAIETFLVPLTYKPGPPASKARAENKADVGRTAKREDTLGEGWCWSG